MLNRELLGVDPLELQFPFELRKQISCSLQLSNKTDEYVAFKVKTTSPKKYCVRPNNGVVPPGSTCDVVVTMQAQREAPVDMQCKDKFLVQSAIVGESVAAKDITAEMFLKDSGNVVDEVKLKVVYVSPPQPPSPVLEGSEEGSSPRPSDVGGAVEQEPGARSHLDTSTISTKATYGDSEEHNAETASMIKRLTEEKAAAIQQNSKLRQELEIIRREAGKRSGGFSLVFVVIVALIGVILGFIVRS